MKINVYESPNSTWVLDGDTFFCSHDEIDVVQYVQDHMGFDGHYQTEESVYECAECGEQLEGSPEEDRYDANM